MAKEKVDKNAESSQMLKETYGSEAEGNYAQEYIQQINVDLELREKESLVFNGVQYQQGYAYNQRKAINYAPPRNPNDDREVSVGLVHEKIMSLVAIFLKYIFKRRVKCYDDKGRLIKGLGKIYELAIDFSYKLEHFKKKLALIYYEVYTQGNAFVLEDWEVMMQNNPKAFKQEKDGKVRVTPDTMDYTYEFLDGLTYEEGDDVQHRRAVSIVLDGRGVIFGNPEIEDLQDQPRITLERELTKADADALYGTLKRWDKVPKSAETITAMTGEKTTIFDTKRHKNPDDVYIEHRTYDKENNRFNIFLNGLMLLPSATPMSIFYPRMNYPISNVPAERLRGSIYARSIPAKTKFNADYLDWMFKMMANKFEQGIDPAILTKGKYTLTRDIFRGGQVTHGVSSKDFERADPENKGITQSEFSFAGLMKDVLESQTLNPTTSGEVEANATATGISIAENNQREKLEGLLDGLVNGFMDMNLRRAESIESKYTIKQKETMVDGKKINVYQNFTVNTAGVENVVVFDDLVGTEDFDEEGEKDKLFSEAFNEKKKGFPTELYLVNPKVIREGKHNLDIEVVPERHKNTQLEMIQMFDEFKSIIELFGRDREGGMISTEQLSKEYLEVSGRPDELFINPLLQKLDQEVPQDLGNPTQTNKGSFGKPTIKNAQAQDAGIKR